MFVLDQKKTDEQSVTVQGKPWMPSTVASKPEEKPFAREVLPAALEEAVKQYRYLFDCKFHGTETQFKALLELGVWRKLDAAHSAAVQEAVRKEQDRIRGELETHFCSLWEFSVFEDADKIICRGRKTT